MKDASYKNGSLFAVSAINSVYIFSINYAKLDSEVFHKKVYHRKNDLATCSWISWGEGNIHAPSREIIGEKLVLNYTFDNKLFTAALNEVEKYD